jgi:tight adherence protein B
MTSGCRLGVTAALTALAVLGGVVGAALPAFAAEGRIVGVQPGDGKINVVFQARGLEAREVLDPRRVTLSVSGQPLAATARPADAATEIRQATILTLDVSDSMKGTKLRAAKQAAEQFLKIAPRNVQVGVASFATKPNLLVRPTLDRVQALGAVRGLAVSGDTALYDAITLSVRSLGSVGVRSIVLLSDGDDTKSQNDLATARETVRRSGVVLDVVAIKARDALPELKQLTNAGRGRLVATESVGDLTRLFQNQASDLGRRMIVSATLPAGLPPGSTTISVTASTGTRTLTANAEVPLGTASTPAAAAGPIPAPVAGNPLDEPLLAVVALLLLFAALATLLGVGFTALVGVASDGTIRRRLSVYTLAGRSAPSEQRNRTLGQYALARSAVQLVDRVVSKRGLEEELRRRLDGGGIRLTPAEWILIHGGVVILLPAFLFLLTGGSLLRASIGLVFGLVLPYLYLTTRDNRRKRRFLEQLPDTLQLLAGSLEAGYSLAQAVDAVAREAQDPVSTEFNRAVLEARLGVPIDDALDSVAERMQGQDFSWAVMAIRIQREVGGNLAEILKTVASTLRERERLRRQLRVVSAEGRLSGWILGGLPVAFAMYLVLVRPDYLRPLVATVPGLLLSMLGVLLMIAGAVWIRRVVDVEV